MHKEGLERTRTLWEDWSCGVRPLQIFRDIVGVGENNWAIGRMERVDDHWKCVYGSATILYRTRRRTNRAQGGFNIRELDPNRSVRKAFEIEDESLNSRSATVSQDESGDSPDSPYVGSPWLGNTTMRRNIV